MRIDPHPAPRNDHWLESRCRVIESAGRELVEVVSEVNNRISQSRKGQLGRRQQITEAHLRNVEGACQRLLHAQSEVQNALFDCEHELRALRERELSPAELLIEGERLIAHYRFLRRRARVLDGLLAYLPPVTTHASGCLDSLKRLRDHGDTGIGLLTVPDCSFALVALDQLSEEG